MYGADIEPGTDPEIILEVSMHRSRLLSLESCPAGWRRCRMVLFSAGTTRWVASGELQPNNNNQGSGVIRLSRLG